ncbi:FAD-dependent oxidoreductase [Pararhizobium haloflavum]|uniref:FAD-dependent oxidoreductase n=1 Tax=Pararhizobium haloflavum TaxID=2037914 RepID=UPI000C174107|nr:FAD-dependent oxidoreductase [Pararhizobium haloflavum]
MPRYTYTPFDVVTPAELAGRAVPDRYPVVIVGAGPVGLALAIDLALHDVPSVVLDDNNVVSLGSRAICWAKRTLEIFDRLGVGDRMVDKGVTWKVGRVFHGEREIYSFDLLPEPGHKMPAFINLQQYYVEHYLVERCRDFPGLIDIRFRNKVVGVEQREGGARARVETPDGAYDIVADWLVACDGARSPVRSLLGLEFVGQRFEERFLIADIEMREDLFSAVRVDASGPERHFWFEPPFHSGQSALVHKQPDDIYRIDLQLGPEADPVEEKKPENVIPRIRAVVGDRPFTLDWVSVYSFQCRRLERFVHGRVLFAGDSAHLVSPFGARGGNGGIHDIDNLGWKLAAVIHGDAGESLIDSFNEERVRGADENIRHSANATNFMTPKSDMEKVFRGEVLSLATHAPFARRLVNSGRLSLPCSLDGLSLQSPASNEIGLRPGSVVPDAPLIKGKDACWLLNEIGGDFALLTTGKTPSSGVRTVRISRGADGGALVDGEGMAFERLGEDMTYLVRPDQHVAAAFRAPDRPAIETALARALGGVS